MQICPSCLGVYTSRGLAQHLAKTKRPGCRQVLQGRIDAIIAADAANSESSDDRMDIVPTLGIDDTVGDEMMPGELGLSNSDGDIDVDYDIRAVQHLSEGGGAGIAPSESRVADENEVVSGDEVVEGDEDEDEDEDDEGGVVPPGLNQEPPTERDTDTRPDELFIEALASRGGEPLGECAPDSGYDRYIKTLAGGANQWAPFNSKLDWELARWAKLRGPGSTAVSDLLSIEGFQDALGLSYKNSRELNKIIDTQLPGNLPHFKRREIKIAGEVFDIYYRNPLECVKALFGDPEFANDLLLKPERHYTSPDKADRLYHEMNTGKWWWETQKQLDKEKPGGTVVPVIISSDKTQVTLFGSKQAYPVYMTIGNIPKNIRRKPSCHAQILLVYLPTTNLKQIPSEAARRRARILAPLAQAGVDGVPMASGDGSMYRNHPILAVYAADYPEQLLVTGIKSTSCPKCKMTKKDLGNPHAPIEYRDLEKILDALPLVDIDPRDFSRECKKHDIKPIIHPFWEDLPYVNIYRSITSDVLHQLYQGMIKHVISWIGQLYSEDEIDARCKRLPPNHHIRLFMDGISSLTRVTGREHSQISSFLLGLIAESPPPSGSHYHVSAANQKRIVRAVTALLDFAFLAQYPIHSTTTLGQLNQALDRFHKDMEVFVDLGIRTDMNFPKLHSLRHYITMIIFFGTTDNYNTEYTERLHIDLAKDAYRATNHKDEYSQMTTWLERKERILLHEKFLRWRQLAGDTASTPTERRVILPVIAPERRVKMTKHPTLRAVTIERLAREYGATQFTAAFSQFIAYYRSPHLLTTRRLLNEAASNVHLPFNTVRVYHVAKFIARYPTQVDHENTTLDSIHVKPAKKNSKRRKEMIPGRFDTALITDGTAAGENLEDHRVGRVRVIFSLQERHARILFGGKAAPKYFAYVEWFTTFRTPGRNHGLYLLEPAYDRQRERFVGVVPVDNIRQSVHLFPRFPAEVPERWISSNVLNTCDKFFLNPRTDRYSFTRLR
ncbi:hypothetical protein BD779DRAFT_1610960 [Infundibulicybe gibba]|nr:hypothetical protein BD779DRAFT_1610960 [Infundibulicybe gibba]